MAAYHRKSEARAYPDLSRARWEQSSSSLTRKIPTSLAQDLVIPSFKRPEHYHKSGLVGNPTRERGGCCSLSARQPQARET